MSANETALIEAFELVAHGVAELDGHRALRVIRVIRQTCDGIEAQAIASAMQAPDDTAAASAAAAAADRKASQTKRRKTAARGAAVKKNQTLGDKLASGEITGEQADLLVDADKASDGAALADDELIDQVSDAGADQTRETIKRWLADRRAKADVKAEYERQRKNRRVYSYRDKSDGLMRLCAAGDDATIKAFKRRIDAVADAMYQADGGRDIAAADHPRTFDQRGFDALEHLLAGNAVDPARTAPKTSTAGYGSDSTEPARPGQAGPIVADGDGDPSHPGSPRDTGLSPESDRLGSGGSVAASGRYTPPIRSQAVIVFHADWVFGDQDQRANAPLPELIGHGPVTEAYVNRYFAAGTIDIAATVLGSKGEPLWQGRKLRHATEAQVKALIVRDRCCGLCGADYSRCEAHHLVPFNAPARGPTDVDKMTLVCKRCHRWLHDSNLTMTWNPTTNRWGTRPATPDEIPPPKPKTASPRDPRGP